MNLSQNVLKYSSWALTQQRDVDANDWWLQQQSNGTACCNWLTISVWDKGIRWKCNCSYVLSMLCLRQGHSLHRLRWKCNCSCVLSMLRNMSSKFFFKILSVNWNCAKNSLVLFLCGPSVYCEVLAFTLVGFDVCSRTEHNVTGAVCSDCLQGTQRCVLSVQAARTDTCQVDSCSTYQPGTRLRLTSVC